MFTAAFTIVKIWKVSFNRQVDKRRYSIYMEYYLAIRKKELLPFAATQMDFEGIILSEISFSDRERYMLYDITYMWSLKKIQQTSKFIKKEADSDIESKLVVTSMCVGGVLYRGERPGSTNYWI